MFDCVESSATLRFPTRGKPAVAALTADDLAAITAELVRLTHIIDDVSAERDRLRSQTVMLVAALEMIRDGNRDPISLAEIGLREAGL